MNKNIFHKIISNPIMYPLLVFRKLFIYPFKYKQNAGYAANNYWHDRLSKYGNNIRGVGEEGSSVAENLIRYQKVCQTFQQLCIKLIKEFSKIKVLEIGIGTGQMTQIIYDLGVLDYHGVDITDTLFPNLKKQFSPRQYNFIKADITSDIITGTFDLVVIIDVIEHIVENRKFEFAMKTIKNSLAENGIIIIAPLALKNKKIQFYERYWTKSDLENIFTEFYFYPLIEWEPGFSYITAISKKNF